MISTNYSKIIHNPLTPSAFKKHSNPKEELSKISNKLNETLKKPIDKRKAKLSEDEAKRLVEQTAKDASIEIKQEKLALKQAVSEQTAINEDQNPSLSKIKPDILAKNIKAIDKLV